MIFVADIGNTSISFGIFDGKTLAAFWRMDTDASCASGDYEVELKRLCKQKQITPKRIEGVVIGSVVPRVTPALTTAVQKLFSRNPLIVYANCKLPIKLSVDNPKEVGADIIANCSAAHSQFPNDDVVIIDFGTATTFDVITKGGEYVGSVFAPSMRGMARSLSDSAALLPEITLTKPKSIVGTNSVDCMQSGIVFGYIGLVDGLLQRLRTKYKRAKVVVTGGYSSIVADQLKSIDFVNSNLTLEGLLLIQHLNQAA